MFRRNLCLCLCMQTHAPHMPILKIHRRSLNRGSTKNVDELNFQTQIFKTQSKRHFFVLKVCAIDDINHSFLPSIIIVVCHSHYTPMWELISGNCSVLEMQNIINLITDIPRLSNNTPSFLNILVSPNLFIRKKISF